MSRSYLSLIELWWCPSHTYHLLTSGGATYWLPGVVHHTLISYWLLVVPLLHLSLVDLWRCSGFFYHFLAPDNVHGKCITCCPHAVSTRRLILIIKSINVIISPASSCEAYDYPHLGDLSVEQSVESINDGFNSYLVSPLLYILRKLLICKSASLTENLIYN